MDSRLPSWQNVSIIPVFHYRMEFAAFTHECINRIAPDIICLELPQSVRQGFCQAVKRLPLLSVLLYPDRKSEQVYLPIEPCDPMVEAARCARELKIPLHFIDLDVEQMPTELENIPDPYALGGMEPMQFIEKYVDSLGSSGEINIRREKYMAYKIQQLQMQHPDSKIAVVCGASHYKGILKFLETEQVIPLGFFRRQNAKVFHLHADSSRSCLAEIGFLSTAYEIWRCRRRGLKAEEVFDSFFSLHDERTQQNSLKPKSSKSNIIQFPGVKNSVNNEVLDTDAANESGPQVFTLDSIRKMLNLFEEAKRPKPKPVKSEKEQLVEHFKDLNQNLPECVLNKKFNILDRQKAVSFLFNISTRKYEDKTRLEVKPWQWRAIRQFLAKRCIVEKQLTPDFFQMLHAARGIVDDDLSYHLWELGTWYLFQTDKPELMEVKVEPGQIWLGTQKISFRRRIDSPKKNWQGLPKRLRPKEQKPGDWQKDFESGGLCSYPVEDVIIEKFGDTLKQKGAKVLSEEHCRVQPFSCSLLDGIDFKETIKNVQDDQIYVRERRNFDSAVGSVVMIFDEDLDNTEYDYRLTWLGEHDQESDLAFYASNYEDQLIGPGIGRSIYGGFVMSYPPGRMFDVWSDPDYVAIPHKHETLLVAALEYSREKHIVYVAPKPPRAVFKRLAERMSKRIIYIPLGNFAPDTIRSLRRFHVLSGHDKRDIIREYL